MKPWAPNIFENLRQMFASLDPEERKYLFEIHKKRKERGVLNDKAWQKLVELDKKYRKMDWKDEKKRLDRIENAMSRVKAILESWDGDFGVKYDRLIRNLRTIRRYSRNKSTFYDALKMVAEKDLELFNFVIDDIYKNSEARETIREWIRNAVLQEVYGTGYESEYFKDLENELEWQEYVYGRQMVKKKSWTEVLQNMYSVRIE